MDFQGVGSANVVMAIDCIFIILGEQSAARLVDLDPVGQLLNSSIRSLKLTEPRSK